MGEAHGGEDLEWSDDDDISIDSKGNPNETNHEVHIRITIILTALFVLKVSRMVIKTPIGETVRMMTSSIMKVSLRKLFHGDLH